VLNSYDAFPNQDDETSSTRSLIDSDVEQNLTLKRKP